MSAVNGLTVMLGFLLALAGIGWAVAYHRQQLAESSAASANRWAEFWRASAADWQERAATATEHAQEAQDILDALIPAQASPAVADAMRRHPSHLSAVQS